MFDGVVNDEARCPTRTGQLSIKQLDASPDTMNIGTTSAPSPTCTVPYSTLTKKNKKKTPNRTYTHCHRHTHAHTHTGKLISDT